MGNKSKNYLKSQNINISPSDDNNLWNEKWIIRLTKDDNREIGTISFEGEKAYGAVPVTICLEERFRNQGYGTEALKLMVDWAFLHTNVYEVKAVTEHENDKCIYALEKAGFVYRSGRGSIEHYSITKPKTAWMGIYILVGVIIGLMLGVVIGIPWVGLIIGLFVSITFGASMDIKANKEREKITGMQFK